jgi:hypothetical protein
MRHEPELARWFGINLALLFLYGSIATFALKPIAAPNRRALKPPDLTDA